jgi:hypothetical protein
MNAAERREHARQLVADWPPLDPATRIRLAVLLRPDLPVGISKTGAPARKGRRA